MEEIIYETPLHDDNQEEILLSLSGELNILAVNNPDVDFEALFVHITSLLRFLDLLNVECKKKQDDLQALSAEVIVLESKLNLEKDLRQEEKDTSFRIQDQAASEMRSLSQRIETLHASLRQLDLHISSITAEKDSYKLKLDDTSNSIKTLKFENENKNKCIENLNLKFDLAKKEISNLKQMTTDKWLDDNIIIDYFSSMQSSVGDMDSNTALDLLKSPSYQACNYVFVAVSDILGEANVGNGSHWSLVFIDKSRHQAYHLDSIVTFNDLPALTTVTNLKIPPENLISVSCSQQNNSYECGINVILNAKFIFNYFCCSHVQKPFLEWFHDGSSFPDDSVNKTDVVDLPVNRKSICQRADSFSDNAGQIVNPVTLKKSAENCWKTGNDSYTMTITMTKNQSTLQSELLVEDVSNGSNNSRFNENVLLIGHSIIRYASEISFKKGAIVELCSGGKIKDIKEKLLKYIGERISVIYFHVGTNNLKRWYNGGAGYNGGHGKREALHDMADLLFTTKTHFPNTMVVVNSILVRSDITYRALFDFNDQLDVMCNNFGVMFVEANCWVKKQHLARDGRHLNRRGSHQLETLFSEVFSVAFGLKKGYDTVGVIPGLDENASKEPILPEEVPCSPSDITQGEHFLEDLSQMTLPL
ncbi:SUMO1 sentrin specific peptidase 8 [Homalodisca vitripennis]|nr:SUMO1 sentrin specific peptidase 8 [Homalodisca vitripennis]